MPIIETINSPFKSRERILLYGREGTGKSTAALSIARATPTSKFWIVDNDNTYDRLLESGFPELLERGQVLMAGEDFGVNPNSWDGSRQSIAEAVGNMARDDWLVVDMLSKLWDQVQEWFIEQVFGDEIDDYFLRVRIEKERYNEAARSSGKDKEKKALGAFEGFMDWPVINQTYHKRVSTPLLNCPGHLISVAEAKNLADDDDRSLKELYGTYGARPGGQKRSGHIMQTVIATGKMQRSQEFKLVTIKDRTRPVWQDEVFVDFAMDYLVGTAGWEVKKEFVRSAE